MPRPRRLYALLVGSALVLSPLVVAASPAAAATTSVAVAGDLQDELGCPADWQPDCPDTELVKQADGVTWSATFALPAGTYLFKVALNDSWAENYGAGGAADGANIPLLLAGPAKVTFSYDDTTHAVSFTPVVAEDTTPADATLAKDSLARRR